MRSFVLLLFIAVLSCGPIEAAPSGVLRLIESPGSAVCIDGTAPGYYWRQGSANGL